MNEKTILERLEKLEIMIESLVNNNSNPLPQKEITQQDFKTFYNRVKNELPKDDIIPCRIWMNNKFTKCLQHNILYPNYETGYWHVVGEPEDIQIGFDNMEHDYYIDCAVFGNFTGETPATIQARKEDKNE